jgi:hypothetical protein
MNILDQAHDRLGVELYRLVNLHNPPEFVKQASDEARQGAGVMPAQCYADQSGRRFPVHTAAATWLSAAYFLEKSAEFGRDYAAAVGRRLLGMAQYWDILPEVEQLAERIAIEKRAASDELGDDAFALVETMADGSKERLLPLRGPAEVKAAAEWLLTYRDAFPLADRRAIATRVLQKAAEYDARPGDADALDRMAGFGGCALKHAVAAVAERAQLARSAPAVAAGLRKIAAELPGAEPTYGPKLAEVLDAIDRSTGLARRYTEGLARPEDVLFAVTEKVASDYRDGTVQTSTGAVYSVEDLSRVDDLGKIAAYLGDDFASEVATRTGLRVDVEKLATVLRTAPRDDAALFDQLMQDASLAPLAKRAGDPAPSLSMADLAIVLGE